MKFITIADKQAKPIKTITQAVGLLHEPLAFIALVEVPAQADGKLIKIGYIPLKWRVYDGCEATA